MAQKPEIESAIPDAELLAMPVENIPAGVLVRAWELHARRTQDKAEEATEAAIQQRLAEQKIEHDKQEEQREREIVLAEYQETMRVIEERSDELLAKIDREERLVEKRRRELEDNALRLHDGRHVYLDGKNYRDEDGKVLTGPDRDEAEKLRFEQPNASKWADKSSADRQYDKTMRMKQEVLDLRREASKPSDGLSSEQMKQREKTLEGRLGSDQAEFNNKVEDAVKETTNYGNDDYMSAYGRTTSYASAIDGGRGKPLSSDFAPAAAGKGTDGRTYVPAVSPPSFTP
jgi:hypothetical protein